MIERGKSVFEAAQSRTSLYDLQEEILEFWRREKIFEKSVESRPADNTFSFYDGPPFITGIPHYATLLPSMAKDIIPRYQTMKGKRVRRVWGWDCHGLPAETKVEQQLGIKSKREIEAMGVGKFIAACRDYVTNVSSEWRWYVDHIGRWADMDNAYRTMDLEFMESVIWGFKELYDKGLIYEGVRSSLYCPRCATPLSKFEITMDDGFYREVEDPAVTVKFKIKGENKYLLAWTTTPWTLFSNRALAVDAKETYVEAIAAGGETVILAKKIVERGQWPLELTGMEYKGAALVGQSYDALYDFGPVSERDFNIWAGDFVTMEEGTGVVHVAPAFGEVDLALGQKNGLTVFVSVDEEGKMTDEIPPYKGQYYKKVNEPVMADLEQRNLLFDKGTIKHAYPFCYRCETPLIYKAQKAWYLKVDPMREQLLKSNQEINWVPEHFKEGRFRYNLEQAPDWCVSRSRYWGTPLPVWKCEACGEQKVLGSVAEIEAASGKKIIDLHRPHIDEVVWSCPCGGAMRRVREIMDVWFESGSMPFAQYHYPFENEEKFMHDQPADFIVEYTGQLRGWFYYLHVIANGLWNEIAFRNVVVTGVMKGNDGRKMSKSFGNYPDPKAILKKYGGEALRLYFMSNPIMQGEDMNVTEEDIIEHYRKTLMIIWNSYRYFLTYARLHNFVPEGKSSDDMLDQWMVGRVESMAKTIDQGLASYDYMMATRAIRPLVEDLSTWYIRRCRARFVAGDKAALETLYKVLVRFAEVTAPLLPFTSEAFYQNLVRGLDKKAAESVHLTNWHEADEKIIKTTEQQRQVMDYVRHLSSVGQSLRREAEINLRQPLAEFQVKSREDKVTLNKRAWELLQEELNVKTVTTVEQVTRGEGWLAREDDQATVALKVKLTDTLRAEGIARELVRHGQQLRRKAGYKVDDRINLILVTDNAALEESLRGQIEIIMSSLQADQVIHGQSEEDAGEDVTIDSTIVHIGVKR